MTLRLRASRCHLPYGITQCYLPPDTSEHTPPYPSQRPVLNLSTPDGKKGWVDLGDLLHTEMIYPPTDGHPSKY